MSPYQSRKYIQALNKDSGIGGIYLNARRASIMVDKKKLLEEIKKDSSDSQKLKVVKKYSAKYHDIIKEILEQ